jgi:hypothetical protein
MLRTSYVYNGYRYLTPDNYNYLVPYEVLDARISHTIILKKFMLNIFVESNNLLNENYQSVTQCSMLLRNFRAGMVLQSKHVKS